MGKQYTAEQREKLVAEVRATGERVSIVAKRMGVAPSSAYVRNTSRLYEQPRNKDC
jgi:transposase-like protein